MSILVEQKIAQAPDHAVLRRASAHDLRALRCNWESGGPEQQVIELELSTHEAYVALRFTGVTDVHIPMDRPVTAVSIRILDLSQYLPEVPAPIRVQHPKGDGLSFWAETVERVR